MAKWTTVYSIMEQNDFVLDSSGDTWKYYNNTWLRVCKGRYTGELFDGPVPTQGQQEVKEMGAIYIAKEKTADERTIRHQIAVSATMDNVPCNLAEAELETLAKAVATAYGYEYVGRQ